MKGEVACSSTDGVSNETEFSCGCADFTSTCFLSNWQWVLPKNPVSWYVWIFELILQFLLHWIVLVKFIGKFWNSILFSTLLSRIGTIYPSRQEVYICPERNIGISSLSSSLIFLWQFIPSCRRLRYVQYDREEEQYRSQSKIDNRQSQVLTSYICGHLKISIPDSISILHFFVHTAHI